jgi:hypothetical protein
MEDEERLNRLTPRERDVYEVWREHPDWSNAQIGRAVYMPAPHRPAGAAVPRAQQVRGGGAVRHHGRSAVGLDPRGRGSGAPPPGR